VITETTRAPVADVTQTPRQPLVVLLGAMSCGIVWDRYSAVPIPVWLSLAFLSVGCWIVAGRIMGPRCGAWCLILAVLSVAGAWHHDRWRLFDARDLGRFATEVPEPVCIEAVASRSPRLLPAPPFDPMCTLPRGDRSRLTVRVKRIRQDDTWRSAAGQANLVVDGHLLDVRAGDRLRIWALLSAPVEPRNPGDFDYAKADRSQRRLCRLHAHHPECVVRVRRPWYPGIGSWLSAVRNAGNRLLWRHVSHSQAGLAAAILLGAREYVDRADTVDFLKTGTIHLLAISGLHVGMLAYGFWWAMRVIRISRRSMLLVAILLVNAYAQLTDARPPVVRAAVLISTLCVARLCGRQAQAFNTLALAGMVVLAWNPCHLFRTGPQLSFLAVGALVCTRGWLGGAALPHDPLDRLIARTRPWPIRMARRLWSGVWRLWAVSGIIWLATLPLVMYRFHLITPVALAVNPIVSFPIAVALFSGFGVLLLGWLAPPLAAICGRVCDVSLSVVEWCVQGSLAVRGGHFWTPAPPLWWVMAFYAGAGLLVAFPRFRPAPRWSAVLVVFWLAVGLGLARAPHIRSTLCLEERVTCTFASVGHGTGALLELPGGKTLLYDAGRRGVPSTAARSIEGLLWSRGIVHLDAIILSHADADHYNALPELLERFSVGVVYVSPLMFRDESQALRALKTSVSCARVPLGHLVAGDELWPEGNVRMTVLHPSRDGVVGSDNANSIVLRIDACGRTILLPGDLELLGLAALLAQRPVDCDVVMAPHHGSARSEPFAFAAWATPEWVVISGDTALVTSDVRTAFRASGARVLHTAESGAIRVVVDSRGVHVRTWCEDRW